MKNYGKSHLSSTSGSKCLICGNVTHNYADICCYNEKGDRKEGTSIVIPVCNEHYNKIPSDILGGYANHINKTIRHYVKNVD